MIQSGEGQGRVMDRRTNHWYRWGVQDNGVTNDVASCWIRWVYLSCERARQIFSINILCNLKLKEDVREEARSLQEKAGTITELMRLGKVENDSRCPAYVYIELFPSSKIALTTQL